LPQAEKGHAGVGLAPWPITVTGEHDTPFQHGSTKVIRYCSGPRSCYAPTSRRSSAFADSSRKCLLHRKRTGGLKARGRLYPGVMHGLEKNEGEEH